MSQQLLEKIKNATKVELHYPTPHDVRYAIVEYSCQRRKPLKVVGYYIYGEELKTGKPLVCWQWQPSLNFNVIENNFQSEKEAEERLVIIKENNHGRL